MKDRIRQPRRNTPLATTLTHNYLVFSLMIVGSMVLSALCAQAVLHLVTESLVQIRIDASELIRPDYRNMDIRDVRRLGGWVEILRDKQVVDVLGTKGDDKTTYTDEELQRDFRIFAQPVSANFSDDTYYYSTALFTADNGIQYLCVVKVPLKNLQSALQSGLRGYLSNPNQQIRLNRLLELDLALIVLLFCLFFASCVLIYGQFTARKITRPLRTIRQGIARITAGDLTTRMDFDAEQEFADIRDALNYMAGRLQQSENEKQELEENRKRMIMGISHDLKTPITTVYGYASALNDGVVTDPTQRQRHLQYIRDKALMMSKLIDDLFRFSTMESAQYTVHRKEGDFAEFLRALIAESYLDIENRGMELDLDIPEDPVLYSFDAAEMGRALRNIIGNSIKYNPQGTQLGVSLKRGSDGTLVLAIRDNGVGISEAIRGTVFEEFVRGNAARPSDGGSGLGLSIARRVIELHGGSISLESAPGKGSTFLIFLP